MSIKTAQSEIMRLTAENIATKRGLEAAKLRETEWLKQNGPGGWIDDLRKERDAALNAFERFRNAAKRHAPLYLIDVEAGTSDPSSALAERDRGIEKRTAERCKQLLGKYMGSHVEVALLDIDREFNLEPKPETPTT